jgi:acyl-[acyl-carrier-protein]-phospholipid O-acyltransferase/long-chain-fatty-acid--[acyl-carrier-protein] ligase
MAHTSKLTDITLLGKENIPSTGFVLLPSQLTHQDLLRLETVLRGRQLVYMTEQAAGLGSEMQAHLNRQGIEVLIIAPETTDVQSYRAAMKSATTAGKVVIYVPAEAAVGVAPLASIPGSRLEFLVHAEAPVLPVYVERVQDTVIPIQSAVSADKIIMVFGTLLTEENQTLPNYQEQLLQLAEQAFQQHPLLSCNLAYALLQGLKKHGPISVIDGKEGAKAECPELRFDKVLAAAIALSKYLKKETQKKRVAIVLPPSPAALIANVAILLAGKVPVNLNFTAARASIESAIKQADVDRFLTADTFVRKVQSFPWPALKQQILLERLLPTLKNSATLWYTLSKALPASLLAALLGIPKRGGHAEATLLFTSGSSGEPKGVVLTHHNLMSNVIQFSSRLNLKLGDSILGCLPLFHSFGCTVTLWYPMLCGIGLVTHPSPLETKVLAGLIERFRISLLIATPTFLRGYMRGVNREQLASLKLLVTGAEKLPRSVAEAFEAKFEKKVLEGYGLTETSPVSNVNLPNPKPIGDEQVHPTIATERDGSVGQILPGMALRITNPETGQQQSIHQSGVIWFKGGNVFTGYLNDKQRSDEVLDKDGWFRTGDIGRLDADGFLYIEGRLSRFSKIAGEMVPHETVEEMINKALGLESESSRKIAIVGVPDIDKGEALVLISSAATGSVAESTVMLELRHRLLESGVPALWIPKKLIRVADIPILSSGKLDVKSCEKIARDATY